VSELTPKRRNPAPKVIISRSSTRLIGLRVECAARGKEHGILFIFSLFSEYIQLEYVRIHVIYRLNQAEYGIHIRVVAPQEYVNIYSTRRKLCAYAGTILPTLVSHRRVVVATCDAWVLQGVPQRRRNVWCSAPSAPRASAGQGAKLAF